MTEPAPRRLPVAKIVLSIAVVVLVVFLGRRLDLDRVRSELARADARLVILAALLNLTVNTAARVGRWRALLDVIPTEGTRAGFFELARVYLASQAISNLVPARAGEAIRVVQPRRRHGQSVAGLVAVLAAEGIVGAISLGALALFVASQDAAPLGLRRALLGFGLLGPMGALGLYWLSRRAPASAADVKPSESALGRLAQKVAGIARSLLGALGHLRSASAWSKSLAWSVLSDATDVAMIGLVLAAVGVHLPVVSWVVAFVAINLALIVPTTPAQLGVLEMGAVAALHALGVDEAPAVAFAVLYHAAHVIPPTLVGGLFALGLESRRPDPDRAA